MKKIKESFIQIIEGNLYTYIRYYDVKTDKFKRIAVVGKSMWSWAGEKKSFTIFKGGWQKYLVLLVENDYVVPISVKPVSVLSGKKSFLLEFDLGALGYIYVYENRNPEYKSFNLAMTQNKIQSEQIGENKRYSYDKRIYYSIVNNMVCEI